MARTIFWLNLLTSSYSVKLPYLVLKCFDWLFKISQPIGTLKTSILIHKSIKTISPRSVIFNNKVSIIDLKYHAIPLNDGRRLHLSSHTLSGNFQVIESLW